MPKGGNDDDRGQSIQMAFCCNGSWSNWIGSQHDMTVECLQTGTNRLTKPNTMKLQILSVVLLCKDTIFSEQTLPQRFIH